MNKAIKSLYGGSNPSESFLIFYKIFDIIYIEKLRKEKTMFDDFDLEIQCEEYYSEEYEWWNEEEELFYEENEKESE